MHQSNKLPDEKKRLSDELHTTGIHLAFYRTLYSQSGASVTMGSIASSLRHAGFRVQLTLLEKRNHKNAYRLLDERNECRILLLKPNFQDARESMPLALDAKSRGIYERVFFCGPYSTLNAQRIMEHFPNLDGILLSEAELTAVSLFSSMEHDLSNWNIETRGGIWRDPSTGKVFHTGTPDVVLDLDELPLPARDIETIERARLINMEASRGCIANCSFCHIPALSSKTREPGRRVRSVTRVIDEMEALYRTLGKTYFVFNDPLFWASHRDNQRIIDFAHQLKDRQLPIFFMIYLRCSPFPDDEVLSSLAEAGLIRVFLGVEAGTAETLKMYRKGIQFDTYRHIRDRLEAYGLSHHIGYIVFHPSATLYEVRRNLEYLQEIGHLHRIGVVLERMRIISGTEMYQRTKLDPDLADPYSLDLAYAYRFIDRAVAHLHEGLTTMFFQMLGNTHRYIEFYCTSVEMLDYMTKHRYDKIDPRIRSAYETFYQERKTLHNLLGAYYKRCLDGIQYEEWTAEAVSSAIIHKDFIQTYHQLYITLQVLWAHTLDITKQYFGPELTEALFTSQEGI